MLSRHAATYAVAWGALIVAVSGCDHRYDGKRLLIEWHDAQTGLTFRVTETPGPVIKQNTELHVEHGSQRQAVLIDDDAAFSTIAFVRDGDWLLVVCRGPNEVWAGYHLADKSLIGEAGWRRLPYTQWAGQGTVVAERVVGKRHTSPASFPQ